MVMKAIAIIIFVLFLCKLQKKKISNKFDFLNVHVSNIEKKMKMCEF